ncbi:MAG: transcription antitermination factor NusB, partial [Dinghuibacter sp.]|nr:transcription antitermination factor NusB [Dinghuibacter sp.]
SRRNIRIKVLQALYSFSSNENPPATAEIQKNLRKQFEQTGALLVYLVHYLVEIALYAGVNARNRASRLLPSEKDLNVDARLSENDCLLAIQNDPQFTEAVKKYKPELVTDSELVKKLFRELEATPEYRDYLDAPQQNRKQAQEMMRFILAGIMLPSEDFESEATEQFSNYDDDIEMLFALVAGYLEKPGSITFTRIISREKELFAQQLAQDTIEKEEVAMEFIKPRLRNWDAERVARIDMLLLRMGICELLFFETIPPKVTLNEYIDLAKEYSTVQSGQFVNGILDNIHKELLEQNRIHKVDFRKAK